jgi:type I restriction enzyme S subunit
MPKNWKTYKLSEALEIKYGKDHKKVSDGDIPIYGTGGIMRFGNQFLYDDESILIPRKGSLNNIYYLNKPFWTVDTLFWSKINKEIVFPKYLFYNLKILDFANMDVGTAIPSLTTKLLNKIEVNIPPLPEQKAIANILSTIDDKIENNLAINKTLEDMAMALYKHWFVDFGPFQDGEFIDSELGLIPKGWEVMPFLELFELLSGGTPKTSIEDYWNGNIYWVSAKDIGGSGSIYINDTEKKITKLGIKKSATKILPEDTVIVVARGSVGKFGMITKPMCMNQSCYGIYSKSSYSQAITYLLIDSLMKHFLNVAYGSVFDTITTSTFKSISVLLPPDNLMVKIGNEIDVLFRDKKTNIKENQTLTKLRDTLLPKLISGEVRLKEFQEEIENVM